MEGFCSRVLPAQLHGLPAAPSPGMPAVHPGHPADPGAHVVHCGQMAELGAPAVHHRGQKPSPSPGSDSLSGPLLRCAPRSAPLSTPYSPSDSICRSVGHSALPFGFSPAPPLCGGSLRRLTGVPAAHPPGCTPCPEARAPLNVASRVPPGNAGYCRRAGTTTTSTPTSTTISTTCRAGVGVPGGVPAEGATRLLSAYLPAALERALGLFGAFAGPAAAVVRWLELPGAEVVCAAAACFAAVLLLAALVAVIVPTMLALNSASFRLREAMRASLRSVDREIEGYAGDAWDDGAMPLALPPQRHKGLSAPQARSPRENNSKGPSSQKRQGAPMGHLGGATWGRAKSGIRSSSSSYQKRDAGAPGVRQPARAQGRDQGRSQGGKARPLSALSSPGSIAVAAERMARQRADRRAPAGEAATRQGLLGALASTVGVVNFVIRAGRIGRRLWGSLQGFVWKGATWAFFWRRTQKPRRE